MKKVIYISGVFTVLLLSLLLMGWVDTDNAAKEALRQGNQKYESADYKEALVLYEAGLAKSPENKALNYNAAQTAYILGEYEKAAGYYEKSEEHIEKFLNAGNICLRSGDAVQDVSLKTQYYSQALQIYKDGIIKYPQNVPLKYNYELVKEKLDEATQDMEQENNDQNEGDDNQENQEQENNENSQGDQEQENNKNSQGDQEQENNENSQDDQEQENNENSQGDQEQDSENSESAQENKEQNSEQDENSKGEQNQQQEGNDAQQESNTQNEGDLTPNQEEIERILQILENQEKESLKNNQEVIGGNEGKYGW